MEKKVKLSLGLLALSLIGLITSYCTLFLYGGVYTENGGFYDAGIVEIENNYLEFSHQFLVYNTSFRDFELINVSASCGCSIVQIPSVIPARGKILAKVLISHEPGIIAFKEVQIALELKSGDVAKRMLYDIAYSTGPYYSLSKGVLEFRSKNGQPVSDELTAIRISTYGEIPGELTVDLDEFEGFISWEVVSGWEIVESYFSGVDEVIVYETFIAFSLNDVPDQIYSSGQIMIKSGGELEIEMPARLTITNVRNK